MDISEKQLALLNLALELERGDPIRASALGHSTFSRYSLACLIDGLDLFSETQQHVADHLRRMATRSK